MMEKTRGGNQQTQICLENSHKNGCAGVSGAAPPYHTFGTVWNPRIFLHYSTKAFEQCALPTALLIQSLQLERNFVWLPFV